MTRHGKAWWGAAVVACGVLFGAPWIAPAVAQQQSPSVQSSPPAPAPAVTSPVAPGATTPLSTPSTPPAAPTPSTSPIPTPTVQATPVAPTPSPNPPPTASPSPTPSESGTMGETRELTSHPAAYIEGKANRDEVFGAITSSIDAVRAALDKAGLKAAGRPIAVFLEADDVGFTYRAEIPIEAIPDGKTSLSDTVKFGQTPVGKAMRFEHRGAYEDIDATYEAITAYLDEKGIDAQDVFVEEYLNDVKTPDDPNLQVDIFVLLK